MNPFLELTTAELRNCDVFGEPRPDSAAVAPCRTVIVTDEMRAADAAAQAQREARGRSSWQPPKSLPPSLTRGNLKPPRASPLDRQSPKPRSSHRRRLHNPKGRNPA